MAGRSQSRRGQGPKRELIPFRYFGKGDDKFPKGDWKAEQAGLLEAIQGGTEAARKSEVQTAKSETQVQ